MYIKTHINNVKDLIQNIIYNLHYKNKQINYKIQNLNAIMIKHVISCNIDKDKSSPFP